jgi:erythromycin esterase-like protein
MGARNSFARAWPAVKDAVLVASLRARLRPLADPSDLDPLIASLGNARVVMLGEASHGTSEFYSWRAAITRRLIEEHDFRFIAVEGDWPDCYRVNRFIRGFPDGGADARSVLRGFERWPTWMWANEEVVALTDWLRAHNEQLRPAARVGFYGLDVYSLWDSMRRVIEYLDDVDPEAARRARAAYGCFDPYRDDVQEYAMAASLLPASCEDEAVAMLRELRGKAGAYREDGAEGWFDAEQNAVVAKNAERYYRTMVRGGAASWNVRDNHMQETLCRLLDHCGSGARAIVWEHNTHIGDARATDMAAAGMHNLGQLARQHWGADDVSLVGFSTHRGRVIAAGEWGAPLESMPVPPAREGSWEDVLQRAAGADRLLLSSEVQEVPEAFERRGHRAIGVIYHPGRERWGNYVPTVLPARYDALLYLEETRALQPLHVPPAPDHEPPETYPSGM